MRLQIRYRRFGAKFIWIVVALNSLCCVHAQSLTGGFGSLQDPSPGLILSASSAIGDHDTAKATFPARLDNRYLLGAVKNQSSCGSCVVFAGHGLLEAAIVREYNLSGAVPADAQLAEQFTIDCLAEIYPDLCGTGSHVKTVLDQMTQTGTTSTKIPYIAYNERSRGGPSYYPQIAACTAWKQQMRATGTAQYPFAPMVSQKYAVASLNDVKALITAYGAAVVTLLWTDRAFSNAQQVTTFAACSDAKYCAGHAVLLVGWDDARSAFLVRNSWGTNAGVEGGYFYIAYSEFENTQSVSQFIRRDSGVYVVEGRVNYPINWAPGAPDPTKRTLGVARLGEGAGSVTSNTGGLNCGTSCVVKYSVGQNVVLTATAATGSRFKSWSGSCSANATPTCSLNMSADQTVVATFESASTTVEPGLAAVLGATVASKLGQAVPVNLASSGKSVLSNEATLIDRYSLTRDEPTLIVDPSFVAGASISK